MPFKPGQSGNPKGRRPGQRTKRTLEAKEWATRLLSDKAYQANLKKRLRNGEAPHMETLLTQYRWGKPPQTMEHSGPFGGPIPVQHALNNLTEDELVELRLLLVKARA